MQNFVAYRRGSAPIGAIVVKLYRAGDTVRGFLRQVQDVDEDGTAFPSEELEPEVALRLAENKRQAGPAQPIFVELAEGVEWNPEWGAVQ
jgi:hypothetical protein